MDTLLMPMLLKSINRSFGASPGLASMVNSLIFEISYFLLNDEKILSRYFASNKLGVPPPKKIVSNSHSDTSIEQFSISQIIDLTNFGIASSLSATE